MVSGLLKSSNLEVAIKAPKICLLTPDALTDFYEEARTAMGFRHENILQCLGISSEPNLLPCLLFEFMDFGDLASILANTRTKNIQRTNLPHLSNVRNFCRWNFQYYSKWYIILLFLAWFVEVWLTNCKRHGLPCKPKICS